jgi:hypothetical protein
MATDLTRLEQRWHVLNEHFAWAPLYPPEPPEDAPLYELPFPVIVVVRSKSDSDTGRAAHNYLLGVLRGEVRDFEGRAFDVNEDELLDLPRNFRFTLLRTNAEIPANPVHHMIAIGINPKAQLIAGFDYKQDPGYAT